MDALVYMRDHGYDIIEVEQAAEDEWTTMVDTFSAFSPFSDKSYFFGTNVPGKPRRFLLNPAGRPKMMEMMADAVKDGYKAYSLARSSQPAQTPA